MKQEYIVPEKSSGLRIDKFLTESCPDYTRSFLQKLLKSELVEVNGKPVKSGYKTAAGDTVTFEVPEAVEAEITAQEMPLDILYEDEDVILINKPKGMVVHPAAGHYEGTLVNGLMHHCRGLTFRYQRRHAPRHCPPDRYGYYRSPYRMQERPGP